MDVPNSAAPEVAASTIKERNLVPVMGSWCFRSMSRPWLGPALVPGASRSNTMTPSPVLSAQQVQRNSEHLFSLQVVTNHCRALCFLPFLPSVNQSSLLISW